jgi:hypothetical protein
MVLSLIMQISYTTQFVYNCSFLWLTSGYMVVVILSVRQRLMRSGTFLQFRIL